MGRKAEHAAPLAARAMAREQLAEGKLGCLPVTEQDGTLVGIVARGDLVELVIDFLRYNEGAAHRTPLASP